MGDVVFDLFGNPVRPGKGRRGRPPYEATEKDRNKVKLLLAVGWSGQRIANALDVSLATVKRYFRAELAIRDQMRDRLDARRLEVVSQLALDEGNVGAIRELGRMLERSDLMGMERRINAAQARDVPADDAPVGKKEAAQAAAKTAGQGSHWGDDLLPQVIQ